MAQQVHNIEQMLGKIEETAGDREQISLGIIMQGVGNRSFGPLLLMVGLILASPLSGIPGMPTAMAVLVALVAVQLLFGRDHFWMPGWLLNRTIRRDRLEKTVRWLRPPARVIDRFLRPRLTVLVRSGGAYATALVALAIAIGMPAMELVPFSATGAGVAITLFGIALVARDGLLSLLAFTLTAVTAGLVIKHLLG